MFSLYALALDFASFLPALPRDCYGSATAWPASSKSKKWRAQVRRANHSPRTRTFCTRKEAQEWPRALETRIDVGTEPKLAARVKVGELIREYRKLCEEGGRPIGPTTNTTYMLAHLEEDLGADSVVSLTPQRRLVQWATMRKGQGAGPYTVNMQLSALGTLLRHAASFLNLQLPDVTGQARPLLLHLQLIRGARRTRRPTDDELAYVLGHVQQRDAVVADAMRVAAITGLRRSEVVRKLLWPISTRRRRPPSSASASIRIASLRATNGCRCSGNRGQSCSVSRESITACSRSRPRRSPTNSQPQCARSAFPICACTTCDTARAVGCKSLGSTSRSAWPSLGTAR